MGKKISKGSAATFMPLGASNHVMGDRELNDYYATPPLATKCLLEKENFSKNIWEPACGEFHISEILEKAGHNVRKSDIVVRKEGIEEKDFINSNEKFNGDIITNPPYKYALDFVKKALDSVNDGNKVAMLLRIQFLEGKSRRELFNVHPPKKIYVFSKRIGCAKNGEFEEVEMENGKELMVGSAICFAWFVWEKGYQGLPVVDWIN